MKKVFYSLALFSICINCNAQLAVVLTAPNGTSSCNPITLNLAAQNTGNGCLGQTCLSGQFEYNLEFSSSGTGSWTTKQTVNQSSNLYSGQTSNTNFVLPINNSNYPTGYYRVRAVYGSYHSSCGGVYLECIATDYSTSIFITLVNANAGADKGGCPNTRVQIGLAASPGSGNTCTPTFTWSPTGNLYYTSTATTPCSPCTTATLWAKITGSNVTYTRTQVCGGLTCQDQVKVNSLPNTCRIIGQSTSTINDASATTLISPNPNSGSFKLKFDNEKPSAVKVFNYAGQIVLSLDGEKVSKNELEIILKNNYRGLYF